MKGGVSKYFFLSFGIHFLLIIIFLTNNQEIQKSNTSILIVEVISLNSEKKSIIESKQRAENKVKKNNDPVIKEKRIVKHDQNNKSNIKLTDTFLEKELNQEKPHIKNLNQNVARKLSKKVNVKSVSKAVYKIGSENNPHPPYPLIARKKGWQGQLTVNVLVNQNGWVDKINIKKSSGYKVLDEISLKTIKKWYFIPASSGKENIKDELIIPIRFVLLD